MTTPPAVLRLNDVPTYIFYRYGFHITSRSVRNWVNLGLRNDTLETRQVKNPCPTHKHPFIKVTTKQWVDEFIARCKIGDMK